eukprot:m.133315 g.133315  ORF g.133315 m.133315 type:complete len:464 (-) comp23809_c0_seq1:49-1440(-)
MIMFWVALLHAFLVQATPALEVTFNTSNVQNQEFLGIGAVYHGFEYMPESLDRGMNETFIQTNHERLANVRLSVARSWYGPDWAMSSWGGPYNWTSTKMMAFYQHLAFLKEQQTDVVLQAGWWFPDNICAPTSTPCNVTQEHLKVYTEWVSNSLDQLVVKRNFTHIKYLVLFTEPSPSLEPLYVSVVLALHQQLIQDGRRHLVKFLGPNVNVMSSTINFIKELAQSSASDVIDIFTGHTYNLNGYEDWFQLGRTIVAAIEGTNKPFMVDEGGKSDEAFRNSTNYGTYIAEYECALINAGAQTTMLWLYEDQYYVFPLEHANGHDSFYDGLHRWGTQPWLPYDVNVRPSWYSLSLMSRFLRHPNGTMGSVLRSPRAADVALAAVVFESDMTLLAVSTNSSSPATVKVTFNPPLPHSTVFYRHLYDPASPPNDNNIIPSSATFNVIAQLEDLVPAGGVAVYTTLG